MHWHSSSGQSSGLLFHKNDWRRYNSEMEPLERAGTGANLTGYATYRDLSVSNAELQIGPRDLDDNVASVFL